MNLFSKIVICNERENLLIFQFITERQLKMKTVLCLENRSKNLKDSLCIYTNEDRQITSYTQYRNASGETRISSSEMMNVFKKYDCNNNGYIKTSELDNFLDDFIMENQFNNADIDKLKISILQRCKDSSGRLEMSELMQFLPSEENFLHHFRDQHEIHIADFMKIWYHYDKDRSGFLETKELKSFLLDLMKTKQEDLKSVKQVEEYTNVILDLFDANKDGKIELKELAKIIPIENNYLRKFHADANLSTQEFEDLFGHYDQDNNGYIEDSELMGFIRDILERAGREPNSLELERYRANILQFSDTDNDGKLSKKELQMLLCK